MGSYKNWNIINLTTKSTKFEAFDEIYQVVLDCIINNMSSSVQSVKYGVINTTDTTTNIFYVIQLISEAYTIKNNTKIY